MSFIVNGVEIPTTGENIVVNETPIAWVHTNGVLVWHKAYLTAAPTSFSATDNEEGQVTLTWTNSEGYPIPTYDVYENDIKVGTSVSSGWTRIVEGGRRTYYVKAVNTSGAKQSASDYGISSGSEIFLNSGTHTFTVPPGLTLVDYCLFGGAGSGAARGGPFSGVWYIGGGSSSYERSGTYAVSGGEDITVDIGVGGEAAISLAGEDGTDGYHGQSSSFGVMTQSGASGGFIGDGFSLLHQGDGAPSPDSCASSAGTYRDGYRATNGTTYIYGGEACQANGGDGSASYANNGSSGSGGGAVARDNQDAVSGSGAPGYCKVSW